MLAGNQNPGKNAWRRYCDDIRDGFVWSMTILAGGESGDLSTPHLVVDFREIFTLPRTFIESLVSQRTTHVCDSCRPTGNTFRKPSPASSCVSACQYRSTRTGWRFIREGMVDRGDWTVAEFRRREGCPT